MESQGMSCDNMLPEPPSEIHGSEKIKRPPNAFMLFAKDNRKNVAKEHPGVTNKEISSILGNIWKSLPVETRETYTNKAKLVEKLHKQRYPGYVYSPIVARLMKKEKKKKKNEISDRSSKVKSEDTKVATKIIKQECNPTEEGRIIKQECNPTEEGQTISHSPDSVAHPVYVPNNPDYYIPSSPELCVDEDEEEEGPADCGCQENEIDEMYMINENQPIHFDKSFRYNMMPERSLYSRNESDLHVDRSMYYLPPYRMEKASSYFSENPQCSHASSSPCCSDTKQFPDPMNSFYRVPPMYFNQSPRTYRPPYYHYSSRMSPLFYNQGRDGSNEDMKPFAYVPQYYPSESYRPSFGYFDRPSTSCYRNSNLGFYPQFNADMRLSQASENTVPVQNLDEDGLRTRNIIFLQPDYQMGFLPNFIKPEPKEPPNSSPLYDSYASKSMKNESKSTDTSRFENKVSQVRKNFLENENPRDSKFSANNANVNLSAPFGINKKPSETLPSSSASQDIGNDGKCLDEFATFQHFNK